MAAAAELDVGGKETETKSSKEEGLSAASHLGAINRRGEEELQQNY
jgi:hypothetical protein